MNTLTLEVFECWRVNNYIHCGLPIPHIELVNGRDAYNFIGVSNDEIKPVELNPTESVGTVQSKLM